MLPLHLPPPIRTSDPDSFARQTVQDRLPKIIDSILAQNNYPVSIRNDLLSLKAELNLPVPLTPLANSQPEYLSWNTHLAEFPGRGWLDLPFYFAEAFFYQRLLEAVNYFVPGPWQGADPFQNAKDVQLQKDIHHFERALNRLVSQPAEAQCESLLHDCLWGNQVDLSNFFGDFQDPLHQADRSDRPIINHAKEITDFFSRGVPKLAYILDNVGIELYFDLGLIDFLLAHNWVQQVTIHLKNYPFFVSDAMPKDILASVRLLKDSSSLRAAQVSQRLEKSIFSGQIQLNSDPLWTSSLTYLEVPVEIERALANPDLAIFKGDLNYRRLLGDYQWDFTTRLEDILNYLHIPVAVMRTLKSQIAASLSADQLTRLNATDPQWVINGRRGIIQLIS